MAELMKNHFSKCYHVSRSDNRVSFKNNENAENVSVDQSQAWGTDTKSISLCVQCSELCAPPLTQCRKGLLLLKLVEYLVLKGAEVKLDTNLSQLTSIQFRAL